MALAAKPAAEPNPGLTLEQSYTILGQLQLLKYTRDSKLVFSPTSVWLETNSGTWRTVAAWSSSTLSYVAGNSVSRDLAELIPLVSKVKKCLMSVVLMTNDPSKIREGIELLDKAEEGLQALKENQYAKEKDKKITIEVALHTLRETKQLFETEKTECPRKVDEPFCLKGEGEEDQLRKQLTEKEFEIIRLKDELRATREQLGAVMAKDPPSAPLDTIPTQLLDQIIKTLRKTLNERTPST